VFLDISDTTKEPTPRSLVMKLPCVPHAMSTMPEDSSGSLQHLQRKLAQNALSEFKIGFENDEFRSKKDVRTLIHTIQEHYLRKLAVDKVSCLEIIRIGWKLPNFALAPILQQVIPLLLKQPAKVQHLQLMINSWVPLPTIKPLVAWHTLETLELQSLRVLTRSAVREHGNRDRGWPHASTRRSSSSSPTFPGNKTDSSSEGDTTESGDDSVLKALPYISPSITTLKLVDCDLTAEHMPDLISILRKRRNLRCLSFRHNRYLFVDTWLDKLLEKMTFLKALDLSICDLNPVDGMSLANALKANPQTGLESLSIAGNYRLGESISEIVYACTLSGIKELECSYCDVSDRVQEVVFDLLATKKHCSLRSLKMQAARITNIPALIRCIEENESLERLLLHHPREPVGVSSHSFSLILDAVRHNHYLTDFQVDLPWKVDERVAKELEHWLTLNRCGRSILVNDPRRTWPNVLAAVNRLGDIDALHWILRSGVGQLRLCEVS
jgi:hypothetical protein